MAFGLQAGTLFAGRYKVLACIAAGGMGAVYEVLHLETERRRALKVMHPDMLNSADLRERFKREARVAAKVESEFIVDVFDAGVDEATQMPFLVMELLKGEELGKRLKRQGRFTPMEVVTYLQQTAMALDKTHKALIVHRDLKPANIFLTQREDGQPLIKVLDFGVAKIVAESATASGTTQSLGTPLYMSPEQYNPEARLTGAADIYALGMVAYTLLVGTAYWAAESAGGVIALAFAALNGPREPATARAARAGVTLPPAFDAWFMRVTARDPGHRFPTATGAVAALAEALGLPLPRASISLDELRPPQSGAPASALTPHPPAPTLNGAAVTRAPQARSRGLFVPIAMAILGTVLGGALFVGLRSSSSSSGSPDAPNTGDVAGPIPAAPAIEPAATPTGALPTLTVEPSAAPSPAPVSPGATGALSAFTVEPTVTPGAPAKPAAPAVTGTVTAEPTSSAKPPPAKPTAPKKLPTPTYSQD
jgi:serine/threonine-protein kinase